MKIGMFRFLLALFVMLAPGFNSYAHEGHEDAPGEGGELSAPGVPITITAEAVQNLGLQVHEARIEKLDNIISINAEIKAAPDRSLALSSRISGRVAALFALEGAAVKKGQPLLEVESRQLGAPPPRVSYVSPIDGIITDRHASPGEAVEPDRHLMEIADLSSVLVEGSAYESQINQIKLGQLARVKVESFSEKTFEGKIERISAELNPESRTLSLWLPLDNKDFLLRPNMRATINVLAGQSDAVIAIPKNAVLGEAGNSFVFVRDEANPLSFERRAVVTGISNDQSIEIIQGVFPGDKVVTTGNYQLQYVTAAKVQEDTHEHRSDSHSHDVHDAHEHESGFTLKVGLFLVGIMVGIIAGRLSKSVK